MSIVTKTGDQGTTSLMYGRRVPKNHPRIEACGALDELNAAIGVARASGCDQRKELDGWLRDIQKDLIVVMGELATSSEDRERYTKDGYPLMTEGMAHTLETLVKQLEAQGVATPGWATPGTSVLSATLDMARVICRRAERRVCDLQEHGEKQDPQILIYLNRLSDLMWMLARWVEKQN